MKIVIILPELGAIIMGWHQGVRKCCMRFCQQYGRKPNRYEMLDMSENIVDRLMEAIVMNGGDPRCRVEVIFPRERV